MLPTPRPKILACTSCPPRYQYATAEILPYIERWLGARTVSFKRLQRIFAAAEIERRGCVLPIEEIFRPRSFEDKNNSFVECALELGAQAFARGLAAAKIEAQQIDFLITVSCTGYMIPSLDAHLINHFRMRRDVQRLPVLQMGCAGGTSALMYATDYLQAHPDKKVAIVAVEMPSLTLQLGDLDMANLVSTAIFADGAACAILGRTDEVRPAILDKAMYNFPDATWLMGYQLRNTGFHIVLDRKVPDAISEHFENIVLPFLERNRVACADVDHFVFHPGSIRILERAESLVRAQGGDLEFSKSVLREHGNMSSATVLYILERVIASAVAGDTGLMLGFGPGFVGQTLLLRWQ
ncbi:MAG: type III polyketide synthase [Planctomycetota bacterium]